MLPRDRIAMVKRARPIQLRSPNGRTFISRYKRSTCSAIPPNIELNRPNKQRPVRKNRRRRRQQCSSRGEVLVVSLNLHKKL